MKTIWKYPIKIEPLQDIDIPEGAEILTLHKQGSRQEDEIYIWCLLDPVKPVVTRHFIFVETGEIIPCEECNYIGTLWLMTGIHVLHLFEILKG